jgi:netrin-G3 ligand
VRTFSLQKAGNKTERIVRQYHFTVWPDHGVPEYPAQLLHFVYKVMLENPTKNGPLVVHCSAGVGRTGTFITLFTQLQRIQAEGTVDVFGFVRSMRAKRCYMVQTEVMGSEFLTSRLRGWSCKVGVTISDDAGGGPLILF